MKDIIRTIPAKITMFMMICVASVICVISVCIALFSYEADLYNKSLSDVMEEKKSNYAYKASKHTIFDILKEMPNVKLAYYDYDNSLKIESGKSEETEVEYELLEDCGDYNWNKIPDNFIYRVTDINNKVIGESEKYDDSKVKYTYYLVCNPDSKIMWNTENTQKKVPHESKSYITIKGYFENGLPEQKEYYTDEIEYKNLYRYMNGAIPVGVISGLAALILYITLMCVSARRPKSEELFPGYLNKVPYDVIFAVVFAIGMATAYATFQVIDDEIPSLFLLGFSLLFLAALFVGLSMDTAARIKEGTLIKNTLIYKVCKWCWKIFKKYVLGFAKWCIGVPAHIFNAFREIIQKLPLIWKSVAVFCGISFIEIVVLMICDGEWDNYFICWFLGHIILFIVICRFALGLRGLQAAGRALAAGDYEHRVDTSKLHFDFKEHGENLNHISEGMGLALEEKMKSERMKTELITNVSHDIKTPLTSIINYADLIGKEDTDNDKIKEYTEVLLRQSERLKRLIEDLVEASKASTGNLEVELAPCQASMFITQIAGEYEEKLEKSGLTLVTKGLDNNAYIMADGRRMLRVFDNLMNNICKYALENSRVYLSLEVNNGLNDENDIANSNKQVLITFKNTSRTELDMSPDELMERFVRGDQSRNTEGNGLGLSIARSLTELQNGTFDIFIDGDLFKVVLAFPVKA